jgi:hypothetical protein
VKRWSWPTKEALNSRLKLAFRRHGDPSVVQLSRLKDLVRGLRAVMQGPWWRKRLTPFGLAPRQWGKVWLGSLFLGGVAYSLLVLWSYAGLGNSLKQAKLVELEYFDQGDVLDAEDGRKRVALRFGGLKGDASATLLEYVSKKPEVKDIPLKDLKALDLVTQIALHAGTCANDNSECIKQMKRALVRLIGGWPGNIESDERIVKERPAAQAAYSLAGISLTGLFYGRSPAKPPPAIAEMVMSSKCDPDNKEIERCLLLTRLVQSIVDNPNVRHERSFWVNLWYGPERLAVWWLTIATLIVLVRRERARRSYEASLKNEDSSCDHAGADPIRTLDDLVKNKASNTEIEQIADIHIERIDQDRMSLDSMIAIFPVIGFVATLSGLIEALAAANRIAVTTGGERSAAILDVTSVLSSCFSTTLLALVGMSVFAVWNMIQGRKEREIIRRWQMAYAIDVAQQTKQSLQKAIIQ